MPRLSLCWNIWELSPRIRYFPKWCTDNHLRASPRIPPGARMCQNQGIRGSWHNPPPRGKQLCSSVRQNVAAASPPAGGGSDVSCAIKAKDHPLSPDAQNTKHLFIIRSVAQFRTPKILISARISKISDRLMMHRRVHAPRATACERNGSPPRSARSD